MGSKQNNFCYRRQVKTKSGIAEPLDNAGKFTKKGSITVTSAYVKQSSSTVKDTGGIHKKYHQIISKLYHPTGNWAGLVHFKKHLKHMAEKYGQKVVLSKKELPSSLHYRF